jgi:hypothetical protein
MTIAVVSTIAMPAKRDEIPSYPETEIEAMPLLLQS